MQMMMTLQCRLTLTQRLGLESEFFESTLVRSEQLLKTSKYQCGLKLVKGLENDNYASVLDFLLAVFAPSWKPAILACYSDDGPRLIQLAEWETIDAIDQALAAVIIELARAYTVLERDGWISGKEPCEYACKVACDAARIFLSPHFPGFITEARAA